ncbi:hypothetical protein, partial [Escherichia coli]|uniref:hypothetical protein n=1 Tax=Escherichia coli TaxID=562 RepID=UPI001954EC28
RKPPRFIRFHVARSKKQRISGQYRQVAAIENHVRSSLLEREMAERIPAGMLTAIHQQAGAAGQTSD